MKKRIALHNLGCKVNAYELDGITGSLISHGYEIVPFTDDADIYIVNTCTVTNIADRKSRQMLHRAKKQNPHALVVALGCYVDTDPAGVEKDPCIDIALGNRDKAGLAEVLATYGESMEEDDGTNADVRVKCGRATDSHHHESCSVVNCNEDTVQARYISRTRAYLKIQDGCNLFCAYCIIPYARGRSVSRPVEDVLREAESIAAQGVKEVVLTGIHISSYGMDFGKHFLVELIPKINEIQGIERIRLGSLEPRMITPETVVQLKKADKLCPHFHLSLQSGCDAVLKRMRRRYTTAEFAASVALLREAFENPAITTDIIVGFPGETEAEFEESRQFIETIGFYETHVFPFSLRKGTSAAKMEGQLTQKEKAARADVLLALTGERAKAYRAQFLDKPLNVLWEEEETIAGRTYLTGHTERYVKVAMPVQDVETTGIMSQQEAGMSCKADDTVAKAICSGCMTSVSAKTFLTDEVLLAEA